MLEVVVVTLTLTDNIVFADGATCPRGLASWMYAVGDRVRWAQALPHLASTLGGFNRKNDSEVKTMLPEQVGASTEATAASRGWGASTVNQQPSTATRQPATINCQPSIGNRQPPTVNRRPSTANRQPSVAIRQSSTVNRQPSTANRQPPTANRQQ